MATVLIVEDEKNLRDAYEILLTANAYGVETAANGKEALERCKRRTYDLILLDMMMPVLDGAGFLEQASLKTKAPQTKIVVLSNLSTPKTQAQILAFGVDRHEIKSNLAPKDVLAIVNGELGNPQPKN
ncbi:MAG TPA: response regulator [Candidatus Saccharimonadales bacterium]|nr:response regulator [Candidatus Saccharimonadales bacterium]